MLQTRPVLRSAFVAALVAAVSACSLVGEPLQAPPDPAAAGQVAAQPVAAQAGTATVAAATADASKSRLPGKSKKKGKGVVQPPAPVPPPLAMPVATHRFEIDPQNDDVLGVVQVVKATKEDTLSDIARRFNVGYEEIVRANPGVDPWLPGAGREIVVPTQHVLPNAPREGIVINVAAMRLYYFPKRQVGQRQVVYTHPIGVGKVGWKTPEGTTKVVRMTRDPTWRPGPGVRAEHKKEGDILPAVVPPGPDNPLGTRALYLGWSQYLIHGTNKPYGVGLRSSHGCIRLYPEDIESIYEMVRVGEKVTVVNQPFVFGWHEGQLHLQAFDVLEDDPRNWEKAQQKLLSASLAKRIQAELKARGESVNWELVSQLSHDPRGIPVSISQGTASVESVVASATRVQNRVPEGASWDGLSNLPLDDQSLAEVLSDRDPQAPAGASTSTAPPRS
jgi:L,D-transpeptidase ErfK/SrfK